MMEKPHSIVLVNVPCIAVHAEKMSLIDLFTQKTNKLQIS